MRISVALALAAVLSAPQARPQSANTATPEISARDDSATFKAKVNLVLVPVVVRDAQGRAVGNLTKDDFRIFDKGKPQLISRFSVEHSGAPAASAISTSSQPNDGAPATPIPDRFVVYLFDDLHIEFGDLVRVQQAAKKHLETALQASDRAAIYTTSGRTMLDFTADREKLENTLARLKPQPMYAHNPNDCPDVDYYMGDLIVNKNDQMALQAATNDALACSSLKRSEIQQAQMLAQEAAQRAVVIGQQDERVALSVIRDVVRRLGAMPGQRTLILVSPGFLTVSMESMPMKTEILDRAARENVMISALDARGLYTIGFDTSQLSRDTFTTQMKLQYQHESAMASADLLAELADGTGGTFFQNNNDLYAGFTRIAARPEFVYTLGFAPQNLKPDGTFHKLKITLASGKGLTVQARRGYYAPKHAGDAEDAAKAEIRDAVFSRDEMHDLPVDLHTEFFKPDPASAKITVLARIDVQHVRFKKVENRNNNDVTVVAALFDSNGNFITATEKVIQIHARDETLQRLTSGVTLKLTFDVKPGSYLVRLVARDAEAQTMATRNGAIDIP